MSELKPCPTSGLNPCPFCGGPAECFLNDFGHPYYYVGCFSCETYFVEEAKDDAVVAWHRRALAPAPTNECICPNCGLRHGGSNADGGF